MKFKPSKTEYTRAMFPQNRRQVFADVVKLHYGKLLGLGLLVFAFSLPLFLSSLLGDIYVGNLTAQLMQATDEKERLAIASQIIAFDNLRACVNIICFVIFGIGMAGFQRVLRQYAWEKNVFLSDFAVGIKQNIVQNILLFLIVGAACALTTVAYNMASQVQNGLSLLFMLPLGIFIFFVVPVCAYSAVCIPVYGNKFRNNVWISMGLYIRYPWQTLLALLIGGVFLVPLLIPNIYCHLIGRVVLCFAAPFLMLAFNLFSYNLLDKYVNKDRHPDIVGIGTFPASTDNAENASAKTDDSKEIPN